MMPPNEAPFPESQIRTPPIWHGGPIQMCNSPFWGGERGRKPISNELPNSWTVRPVWKNPIFCLTQQQFEAFLIMLYEIRNLLLALEVVQDSHGPPHTALSTRAPLKGKHTIIYLSDFLWPPWGDNVHSGTTQRVLSLKRAAVHRFVGFDTSAFPCTPKGKVSSNGPNINGKTHRPHGTAKWAPRRAGEGNKCHKNVISPLNWRTLLAPALDTYSHINGNHLISRRFDIKSYF